MSLSLLPIDLFIELVNELQPFDVLAIGQTCKDLHDLTSDRSIWERIIRNLCAERRLSLASYPFKDMGILDLQHAALAPRRWEAVVQHSSVPIEAIAMKSQARKAFFKYKLQAREAVELDDATLGFDGLILVPGGRFLVCTGFDQPPHDGAVHVKVLDLGFPGHSLSPNGRVVLRRRIPCLRGFSRSTHETVAALSVAGESNLTVAVLVKPSIWCLGNHDSMLAVFSVSLGESNASFGMLGLIHLAGLSRHAAKSSDPIICGDDVFLNVVGVYIIWNFKQGWYKAWKADHDPHRHLCISFTGDLVIRSDPYSLSIWNIDAHRKTHIPVGSTVIDSRAERFEDVIPNHTLDWPPWTSSHPDQSAPPPCSVVIPTSSQRLPIAFDVFSGNEGRRLTLSMTGVGSGAAEPAFKLEKTSSFRTYVKCQFPHWPRHEENQL